MKRKYKCILSVCLVMVVLCCTMLPFSAYAEEVESQEDPPIVIIRQPETVYVPLGRTFSVSVEAIGEGLTYQWYYAVAGTDSFTLSSEVDSVYSTVMTVDRVDRRLYCKITDVHGNTVDTDIVTVKRCLAGNNASLSMTDLIVDVDAATDYSMTLLDNGSWSYLMRTGVQYKIPFGCAVDLKAGQNYAMHYKMRYTQADGGTDKIRSVVKLSLVTVDGLHVTEEIDLSDGYDVPMVEWYCSADVQCDGVYVTCISESDSEVMLTVAPTMYITQPVSKIAVLDEGVSFVFDLFKDMAGNLLKTPLYLIGIAVFVVGGIIVLVKRIM